MGARKKTTRTVTVPRAPSRAQLTVVLEDIRSQFKVFGESLAGLRDEVRSGFAQVDARFAQVDARFDRIDARFAQNESRLAQNDSRFDRVDRRLDLLQTAVLDNSREIRELRGDLARKVDRDEVVTLVEQELARR